MSTQPAELEAIVRELEALLGPEDLERARYQERVRQLRFLSGLGTSLGLALLWIPTGWAVALRDALKGNDVWWGTWAVLLAFLLTEAVLTFPLTWYFGFHVENRLGTNRQSFGGWLIDELKQAALGLPLQSLLFLAVYLVFRRWPDRWLPGIAVVVVLFLALVYLLQPLFLRLRFRAEPLKAPELEERIRRLFERAGQAFSGLAVLRAGEKTARGNAALVPKGAGTEVVVLDTLLEAVSPEAVEVVVAHELGHRVHRDLSKLFLLLGVGLILALAVGYRLLGGWGTWDGLEGPADVATYPLLVLILTWLGALGQVLLNAYSRRAEYAADRYALETTGNAAAFEEAMKVLARQNKVLPLPPAWAEILFYSHPSLARRILAARRWKASTG